jgi:DNA replication and repair protein RecF
MHLIRVECEHFRGLDDVLFEPGPGFNIIRGGNAQGKTTLLEAILYAATSKSHRTNQEKDLLAYDGSRFQVKTHVQRQDREVTVEAHWWNGVKRFKVNGVAQTRVSDILGRINVVLFSPEDVGLVKGSASLRRRFLDMELSQVHPAYLAALQQYRQVLKQRNELLRQHNPDPHLIGVWDTQLVQHGTFIIQERTRFIEQLSELAEQAYDEIAGAETLNLSYRPNIREGEDFEAVLGSGLAVDVRRHLTQRGPHRDDMEIVIAGRPARTYASQGQQKTAALALKLAELELLKVRTGEYPIFMLDEVLAELDAHRSSKLFAAIAPEVQCLVTTTELDETSNTFGESYSNFLIEGGRLEKR